MRELIPQVAAKVNAGAANGAMPGMCGESVSASAGSSAAGAQLVSAGSGWVSNSSSSRTALSMNVFSGGDVIADDESAGLGGKLTRSPSVVAQRGTPMLGACPIQNMLGVRRVRDLGALN